MLSNNKIKMKISIGKPWDYANNNDKLAALHEAGHAVIGTVLKLEIDYFRIWDNGNGEGMLTDQDDDHPRNIAVMACAGSIVENLDWINEYDFEVIKNVGFSEKDLPELFDEAKILCDEYQGQIKIVAAELLKKKKLTGEEIKKLVYVL